MGPGPKPFKRSVSLGQSACEARGHLHIVGSPQEVVACESKPGS